MEDGHVTRSDKDFRMLADQREVKVGQDPSRTVSAPRTKNSLHLVPKKHVLQGRRPVFVSSGEESPTIVQMWRLQNIKAHAAQGEKTTPEALPIHRA